FHASGKATRRASRCDSPDASSAPTRIAISDWTVAPAMKASAAACSAWLATNSTVKYASANQCHTRARARNNVPNTAVRSEEHTSELQSRENLVCRLLLEKKK